MAPGRPSLSPTRSPSQPEPQADSPEVAVTVTADGAETIDGAATYEMSVPRGAIFLYSDGTNWMVL